MWRIYSSCKHSIVFLEIPFSRKQHSQSLGFPCHPLRFSFSRNSITTAYWGQSLRKIIFMQISLVLHIPSISILLTYLHNYFNFSFLSLIIFYSPVIIFFPIHPLTLLHFLPLPPSPRGYPHLPKHKTFQIFGVSGFWGVRCAFYQWGQTRQSMLHMCQGP